MTRLRIHFVVFLAGLAAVCWVGASYATSNPFALIFSVLIAACYCSGAAELYRYHRATMTLTQAVDRLTETPPDLGAWLGQLHPSLCGSARLRIEGERAALPGPLLTPYLVGLLVLLGMLGTLLGMVTALRGTGLALDSAADLQAVRASLAAPVKGLGFAFGTSIAGVATSAMLGLLSALCRRERTLAARLLDTRIATTLRVFSHVHQREQTFSLLQQQAGMMPALVGQLQTMIDAIEHRNVALNEQHLTHQRAFQEKIEASYSRLAVSVEQSLTLSVAENARVVGAALEPVMVSTMDGLAREATTLRETVSHAVQRQVDELSSGLGAVSAKVADTWQRALDEHQQTSRALSERLGTSLDQFSSTLEQRTTGMLDGVAARLDTLTGSVSQTWTDALAQQAQGHDALAVRNEQALTSAVAAFEIHAKALGDGVRESHATWQSESTEQEAQRLASWRASLEQVSNRLGEQWNAMSDRMGSQWDGLSERLNAGLSGTAEQLNKQLSETSEKLSTQLCGTSELLKTQLSETSERLGAYLSGTSEQLNTQLSGTSEKLNVQLSETTEQLTTQLNETSERLGAHLSDASTRLGTQLNEASAHIGAQWRETTQRLGTELTETNVRLGAQWEQVTTQSSARQQEICDTLAQTAKDITAQTQAHARETIAEIERLVHTASEAPRAAAEVVAELRQKLSDSMVRDTAMLDERARLLQTVETLLAAVNHASSEQRGAIDALVSTSSDLLDRVGRQFTQTIEAEATKLDGAAADLTGSAVEVASLGEAFGASVQLYGESNEKLIAHLERIESALEKSVTRNDEQLAYYVAQAKEVIDLCMMSQKQMIEEMQALAQSNATDGAASA